VKASAPKSAGKKSQDFHEFARELTADIRRDVGENMRAHREAKGLTQKQLADRASVTQATVSRLESGVSGNINAMVQLYRVLGAPPSDLLARSVRTEEMRRYEEAFHRIATSALDRLDRLSVLTRLSRQLVESGAFSQVRFWTIEEKADRAILTPGAESVTLVTTNNPVAEAFRTRNTQVVVTEETEIHFVPVRRGDRTLAIAELECGELTGDRAAFVVETAAGLLDQLGLLLLLSEEHHKATPERGT
jgi:transcriptional regulator with XRE-family HTH domain